MTRQLALLLAVLLGSLLVSPAALAGELSPAMESTIQSAVRGVSLVPKLAVPDQNPQPAKATDKQWTHGGKIMTGIGLAVAGAGVVMMAAAPKSSNIGDSGVALNWRATGAIWTAGGGVLALIGLTRRK